MVLNCAVGEGILREDLVTLEMGVVEGELKVLKLLPTLFELISSSAWMADNELRMRSMIVVGFSVVILGLLVMSGCVLSCLVGFLVANFSMADGSVLGVVNGVVVASGTAVVDIAVMLFIMRSIMDTGFSVVVTLGK